VATPLQRARVYRNVELRQQFLGLEPLDAIAIGGVAWLLMLFNRQALGWNVVIVMLAYLGLRLLKRGKPEGWTTAVVRFYARRPFFSAAAPDDEGAAYPFPFPTSPARGRRDTAVRGPHC
jgi:hypothetical protein